MQTLTLQYLLHFMKQDNKRVDTIMCERSIMHEALEEPKYEKGFEYEVLGIDNKKGTFIVINDFGYIEGIKINDPRFSIDSYISNSKYPSNLFAGIGMNKDGYWCWFE